MSLKCSVSSGKKRCIAKIDRGCYNDPGSSMKGLLELFEHQNN